MGKKYFNPASHTILIPVQYTNADYAMADFTKTSGRRADEDPLPDISRRSKND